jgi:hypothetical protein
MDVMHERVAGLDAHKETVVACVRVSTILTSRFYSRLHPGRQGNSDSQRVCDLFLVLSMRTACGPFALARTPELITLSLALLRGE